MKSYTIFAGVNGAGKTSIYESIYYNENKDEKRVNTDEMVARIGSWKDDNLQMRCAREAVKLIKKYIIEGISFNQETTLSGKSITNNIKLAKENGFHIKEIINFKNGSLVWKEKYMPKWVKDLLNFPSKNNK